MPPSQQHSEGKAGIVTPLRLLYGLLGTLRGEYFAIVVAEASIAALEGALHPLLIKAIFDQGVTKNNFHDLAILAIAYLGFGTFVNLVGVATALWNTSLQNRILKGLTRKALASYFETDYRSILEHGQGYFISRVYGDLREGLLPLLQLLQSSASKVAILVSSSAVLIYLSWQAFLVLGLLIPISASLAAMLRRKIRELTVQEREQDGTVLAVLSKALGAFRIVRGFDLFAMTADALDHRVAEYFATVYSRKKASGLFQAINGCVMVVSDFCSLIVGAVLVIKGVLTFGGYLAIVNTFWRTVSSLTQLLSRAAEFHSLGAIVDRLGSLLGSSRTVYYTIGPAPVVTDITFSYGGRTIIKDFSLRVAAGEKVLILGPNGVGKTTLANILSGYLAPSKGEVMLPKIVSAVTLPISFPPLMVEQLPVDRRVLAEFGLDGHTLSEFADELSAGQQQKLALALALSHEADAYILDEPLACLDEASRSVAMALLLSRVNGKSLIVIMHGGHEYRHLFDRIVNMVPVHSTATDLEMAGQSGPLWQSDSGS